MSAELKKYMNDFAELLIEVDKLKSALSGVELRLGKINAVYLNLLKKETSK